MKLKVGDKVRIKSKDWFYKNKDCGNGVSCNGEIFVEPMSKYCGRIMTIEEVKNNFYSLEEDHEKWDWTSDMFELLELNVGDTVKIKSFQWFANNVNESGDVDFVVHGCQRPSFVAKMSKYCGRSAVIKSKYHSSQFQYYKIDIDHREWNWTEDMFDLNQATTNVDLKIVQFGDLFIIVDNVSDKSINTEFYLTLEDAEREIESRGSTNS